MKNKKISLKWLDVYNSIRQVWTINPKTQIKQNKKKYNRKADKQKLKKELK